MPLPRRRLLVLPFAAGALGVGVLSVRAAGSGRRERPVPGDPPESTVFTAGAEGHRGYRIPAVVRTAGGALLAFAEARGSGSDSGSIVVVAKRSTDGGGSWGPLSVVSGDGGDTRGNPVPAVDPRTGRVVLLTCSNAATATEALIMAGRIPAARGRRVWVQHSDDDGRTFSAPAEITAAVKRPGWRWYATGPGHATVLDGGPWHGRMVVAANHSAAPPAGSPDTGTEARYYGGHCLLSDDGGSTWRIGFVDDAPDGAVNPNESAVAQLPDGSLYFNARDQNGSALGVRVDAVSRDGGRSLERPYAPQPALAGPVVEGSLLQPDGGPLLFAGPADPHARAAMTLRASADGGRTWTPVRTLSRLPAGYSDLVRSRPGEVGVLYETGTAGPYERIVFARVPLRDLTV